MVADNNPTNTCRFESDLKGVFVFSIGKELDLCRRAAGTEAAAAVRVRAFDCVLDPRRGVARRGVAGTLLSIPITRQGVYSFQLTMSPAARREAARPTPSTKLIGG